MKENTLYYTENYVKGHLIDSSGNITIADYKEVAIDAKVLVNYLEERIWDFKHKCITVYRHAFILNGDIYNICLSCGDFYKNDEVYYLKDIKDIKDLVGKFCNKNK